MHAVEEGAGLAARAPVDLRVNTLKATREKVVKALDRYRRRADAARAGRRARAGARRRRQSAAPRGGDGARQGLVRGAGRGLADRRAARRRRAAHAGARFVRRRRRQDAGARRGDAEHRPDLRLRRRQEAAAAHLRAAEARRGAQRAGDGRGRRGGADGAGAALRPRAGRCPVHGLGHLAAQARRQVAREAGATFPSARPSRRACSTSAPA